MIARIEFKVDDEEEFERIRDVAKLPGETWILLDNKKREIKRS